MVGLYGRAGRVRTQNGGFRPGQIEEGGVLTAPGGALPLVIEVAGIAQVPHVAHHSHSIHHTEVLQLYATMRC